MAGDIVPSFLSAFGECFDHLVNQAQIGRIADMSLQCG
jgi:hypothetical protein